MQKQIPITEGVNLQLFANFFNMANHQNVDSISSLGYKMTSTGSDHRHCNLPGWPGRHYSLPDDPELEQQRLPLHAASDRNRGPSQFLTFITLDSQGGGFGRRPFS